MIRRMRVLELSDTEGAAAFCGKVFVRNGVEVIRVERPDRPSPSEAPDRFLNGGKRRVALDVSAPEDRATLSALAATCDVLVTDLSAREVKALDLLALGSETSPAIRVSITPFGLSGPYADWEASASTLLAMAGHSWLAGDPGRAPLTMPWRYPQYQSGHFAYIAALAYRRQAGEAAEPRRIEISMFETLTSLHQYTDTMWRFSGRVRTRLGNRFENNTNVLLPCRDGWYEVSLPQNFWVQFAHMIGRADIAEEGRLSTAAGRIEHHEELAAVITESLGDWSAERIMREGQEVWRVPIGYAATLGGLLDDEQLASAEFWRPLPGTDGLTIPGRAVRTRGLDPSPEPPEPPLARPGDDSDAVIDALPSAPETTETTDATEKPAPPPSTPVTGGPLSGVRVLDMTRVWAGPVAARILGDLGADVIRIEAPSGRGPAVIRQPARGADFPDGDPGERPWNRQGLFNKLNRNKRSLAVNLKEPRGRDLFLALVAESDVVIENFSARVMPGLGLDYERLREARPDIIYVAMPAFGLGGPRRDYIGFGSSIEPSSGFTALMGYSDREPRITAAGVSDPIAGTTAVAAVLTALERRDATGDGAFLELSQQQAGINFIGEHLIERQLSGHEPERRGNGHPEFAPHGVYRCRGEDDWIALAVRDEVEWAALVALAGRGWGDDARFSTVEARRGEQEVLDAEIERWTGSQDKFELTRALQAVAVPAGPVLSAPEWLADEHLAARDYFVELDHPDTGRNQWDGSPIIAGERDYGWWTAAPTLGGDNEAILGELGLSQLEIAALYEAGVIADRPPGG
jgi:crotonobetainyl-CoA:carnitine CoA-transferase CaiB-like acyl-CoA transferase